MDDAYRVLRIFLINDFPAKLMLAFGWIGVVFLLIAAEKVLSRALLRYPYYIITQYWRLKNGTFNYRLKDIRLNTSAEAEMKLSAIGKKISKLDRDLSKPKSQYLQAVRSLLGKETYNQERESIFRQYTAKLELDQAYFALCSTNSDLMEKGMRYIMATEVLNSTDAKNVLLQILKEGTDSAQENSIYLLKPYIHSLKDINKVEEIVFSRPESPKCHLVTAISALKKELEQRQATAA